MVMAKAAVLETEGDREGQSPRPERQGGTVGRAGDAEGGECRCGDGDGVREATAGTEKSAMGSFMLDNNRWPLRSDTNAGAIAVVHEEEDRRGEEEEGFGVVLARVEAKTLRQAAATATERWL
uniref:DUF834 domain-containing protein n=1 Tax=Oryza punctata TaxID=4537 RepID=A0A0E0KCK1_ORYPU